MNFSEKFKAARCAKKITQQQIADELSINRSAIAHYENGTAKPQLKNIRKICDFLDLKVENSID